MNVRVTDNSDLVFEDKEYKAGDELVLDGEQLEVQLNAGIVEEVTKGSK